MTVGALGFVWGLVRGNQVGWGSVEVVGSLALGVLLAVAFVAWELRAREPMLPMRFFRSRAFSAGSAAIFFTFELQRTDPAGLRYATFQLDDGVSFVHLASIETEDGRSPLSGLKAFQQFQENIGERCDEAPVATALRAIGSFRLWDD